MAAAKNAAPQAPPPAEENHGRIVGRAIIEIVGKPKEHVDTTLHTVVENIKAQRSLKLREERFFDAKEKGPLFAGFVELELTFTNPAAVIGFCFDFMPSSLEIIEPEELAMKSADFAGLMNDLLAKLHDINLAVANKNVEISMLHRNIINMLRNTVTILLTMKELTLAELSQSTGVNEKELKPILESFVTEKLIGLRDSKQYYLIT